jgi:hypothetical protein
VVVPSYNCAAFIQETIDSLLNQTYKNIEIIVVDDGSTDNTIEVLDQYIKSNKIVYRYQQNKKAGAARNHGIITSTGEYIAFVDADDSLVPDGVERRVELLKHQKNVDMVFSNYYIRRSEHEIKEGLGSGALKEWARFSWKTPQGFILRGRFCDMFGIAIGAKIATGTIMVRKKIFQEIGMFREDLKLSGEDTDMWVRIVEYKPEFGYIEKPLYYYNRHRSTLTRSEPFQHAMGRKAYLEELKRKYKSYEGRRRIIKAINSRLTYVHGDLGYYFYQMGRRFDAVENFLKSIFFKYNNWMVYKYLVLAILSRGNGSKTKEQGIRC